MLDFVLIGMISGLLLTKLLLPWLYPETIPEFTALVQSSTLGENMIYEPGMLSAPAEEGIVFAQLFMTMLLWFYFALCETFAQGGSLGKSVYGLRVMSMRGTRPSALEICVRASIKAICFVPPVLLLLNLVVMLLNRQRRAGHDILANTVVVASDAFPVNPE